MGLVISDSFFFQMFSLCTHTHAILEVEPFSAQMPQFNPYKPGVLFMGHRQTVQNLDMTPQNVASNQVLQRSHTKYTFKI